MSDNTETSGGGESVAQRVTRVVAEELGHDPGEIQPSSEFGKDIEADSLDMVELIMALEKEFEDDDLHIPDEASEKIATIQQLVDFIQEECSRA